LAGDFANYEITILALYGFQGGGLSDHHLPRWQVNEDFVTHCFGKTQADVPGSREWS
jgi:hypothetical protein